MAHTTPPQFAFSEGGLDKSKSRPIWNEEVSFC
jgi:hypothetical protein